MYQVHFFCTSVRLFLLAEGRFSLLAAWHAGGPRVH